MRGLHKKSQTHKGAARVEETCVLGQRLRRFRSLEVVNGCPRRKSREKVFCFRLSWLCVLPILKSIGVTIR